MMDMKYIRCKADHDIWYRHAVKPNGFEYYEYVLIFVDDILNISHDTKATMETLGTLYHLNTGSVGPHDCYLGGNVGRFQLDDGTMAWFMSANDYVKASCANVVTMLEKDGLKLETDIKMDRKFTRKDRFVAGVHMTEPPPSMTFSIVVTRESVRFAFLLAGLNKLDVQATDTSNTYFNAPCRELIWIFAVMEFGSHEGCVMKVVRAWYGLKSSGASWNAMLSHTMMDMIQDFD